jgi:hypothetical protein
MKKINQLFPLVAEPHPDHYKGYEFLTLICFNGETFITIIDNVVKGEIIAYVLDFCAREYESQPEASEDYIIKVTHHWFTENRTSYPVSIEFAKSGISLLASKIIRKFPVDFVTRVIGPLPTFAMGAPTKIKKRKKKGPPRGIEVVYHRLHET